MRWKSHVRFGRRPGETHPQKRGQGAPGRSHWATKALDEVRRQLWRSLKGSKAAKAVKGLRWVLLRSWDNLTVAQRDTIRELETSNRRLFRAWQLKEELADIFAMPLLKARRALDDWLHYASRSRLEPFVKLARTIRRYRDSIEATNRRLASELGVHQRHRRSQQLRHRPHPPQRQRLPQPPESFITMIMLDRGGLGPTSPGHPEQPTRGAVGPEIARLITSCWICSVPSKMS